MESEFSLGFSLPKARGRDQALWSKISMVLVELTRIGRSHRGWFIKGVLIAFVVVASRLALPWPLKAVADQFGRLDVLINNAGTTAPWKPKDLESISLEDWDRVFAVNVRGLFQVTRAAVPLLRVSKGCIVNTASIVGLRPGPQPLPYAASKAAVVNLTKTLAYNLGPDIRVNAVAPGWMEGEWMRRMLQDKYEDLMAKRAKATPLKRCVTAEDVAETMMSLVQSNSFVTGEVIVVDGGFSSST